MDNGKEHNMIEVVDGQAHLIYYPGISTWAALCLELIIEYNKTPFTSINSYGLYLEVSSIQEVEEACDILLLQGDF